MYEDGEKVEGCVFVFGENEVDLRDAIESVKEGIDEYKGTRIFRDLCKCVIIPRESTSTLILISRAISPSA